MPIISAFFGRDHEPAHFHAEHAGQHAKFDFSGRLVAEIASRKARRRIQEWAELHRTHLEANWEKMKVGQSLESIEPLSEKRS
jgi:hypothetical protein